MPNLCGGTRPTAKRCSIFSPNGFECQCATLFSQYTASTQLKPRGESMEVHENWIGVTPLKQVEVHENESKIFFHLNAANSFKNQDATLFCTTCDIHTT